MVVYGEIRDQVRGRSGLVDVLSVGAPASNRYPTRWARMTTDHANTHDRRCARDLRLAHQQAIGTSVPPVEVLHQLANEIHRHCRHNLLKDWWRLFRLGMLDAVPIGQCVHSR